MIISAYSSLLRQQSLLFSTIALLAIIDELSINSDYHQIMAIIAAILKSDFRAWKLLHARGTYALYSRANCTYIIEIYSRLPFITSAHTNKSTFWHWSKTLPTCLFANNSHMLLLMCIILLKCIRFFNWHDFPYRQ